mmetsp:Transcript_10553/g.43702  ORF Transcript_10553/g.43702 Transcript_10553/m.43702 type:complete len:987 (-) Transcript_10553:12-2972(-)
MNSPTRRRLASRPFDDKRRRSNPRPSLLLLRPPSLRERHRPNHRSRVHQHLRSRQVAERLVRVGIRPERRPHAPLVHSLGVEPVRHVLHVETRHLLIVPLGYHHVLQVRVPPRLERLLLLGASLSLRLELPLGRPSLGLRVRPPAPTGHLLRDVNLGKLAGHLRGLVSLELAHDVVPGEGSREEVALGRVRDPVGRRVILGVDVVVVVAAVHGHVDLTVGGRAGGGGHHHRAAPGRARRHPRLERAPALLRRGGELLHLRSVDSRRGLRRRGLTRRADFGNLRGGEGIAGFARGGGAARGAVRAALHPRFVPIDRRGILVVVPGVLGNGTVLVGFLRLRRPRGSAAVADAAAEGHDPAPPPPRAVVVLEPLRALAPVAVAEAAAETLVLVGTPARRRRALRPLNLPQQLLGLLLSLLALLLHVPRHERQREQPALLLRPRRALLDGLHRSELSLGQSAAAFVRGAAGCAADDSRGVVVAVGLGVRGVLVVVVVPGRASLAADADLALELLADAELLGDGLLRARQMREALLDRALGPPAGVLVLEQHALLRAEVLALRLRRVIGIEALQRGVVVADFLPGLPVDHLHRPRLPVVPVKRLGLDSLDALRLHLVLEQQVSHLRQPRPPLPRLLRGELVQRQVLGALHVPPRQRVRLLQVPHDLFFKVILGDEIGVDRRERLLAVHLVPLHAHEIQSGLLPVLFDDGLPLGDVRFRGFVCGFALDALVDHAGQRNRVWHRLFVREAGEPAPRRPDRGRGGALALDGGHQGRDGEARGCSRVGEVRFIRGADRGAEGELALAAVLGDAALEPAALAYARDADDVGDERGARLLLVLLVVLLRLLGRLVHDTTAVVARVRRGWVRVVRGAVIVAAARGRLAVSRVGDDGETRAARAERNRSPTGKVRAASTRRPPGRRHRERDDRRRRRNRRLRRPSVAHAAATVRRAPPGGRSAGRARGRRHHRASRARRRRHPDALNRGANPRRLHRAA